MDAAIASGQKFLGVLDSISMARAFSRRVRFFLSDTPFCSGVYGQVVWWTSPLTWQKVFNFELTNSPIVRSKDFYIFLELGLNKGVKVGKMFKNFVLVFHKVDPSHTSTIIYKEKEIFEPLSPYHWRGTPHIRMNKRKQGINKVLLDL